MWNTLNLFIKNNIYWEFPADLVVSIQHFHHCGPGSALGLGTEIPYQVLHTLVKKAKKKKKKKKNPYLLNYLFCVYEKYLNIFSYALERIIDQQIYAILSFMFLVYLFQ